LNFLLSIILTLSLIFKPSPATDYSVYKAATESKYPAAKYPDGMIEIRDINSADLYGPKTKMDELVKAGEKTLMFQINSYGGSIFQGWDFIQAVEQHKKKAKVKVVCAVDVKAYSMGFAFLQSFCDERLMTKRSTLLAHNGSTQVSGTSEDLENELQFMRALDIALAATCAKRLHMTPEEYAAKTKGKDWTMSWEEALKAGAVDGTVDEDDLPPLYDLPKQSTFNFLLKLLSP
jgi:ATP-dependent protease ClpP protease subunit